MFLPRLPIYNVERLYEGRRDNTRYGTVMATAL